MPASPTPLRLVAPSTDPATLFEHFRGNFATELLTAAVAHFHLFEHLAEPLPRRDLQARLALADRPFVVLTTALRAMGLLAVDTDDRFVPTAQSREHLTPGGPFDISAYIGLAARSPGVLEMVERLRANQPAGASEPDAGAAFIYRDGIASAMEHDASARELTLALAGRARNVAPVLAARFPVQGPRLLDIGGGTGLYAYAYLQAQPDLHAVVWDRPEVLKVAAELAAACGVSDRVTLVPGDMFDDPVPDGCQTILLSNILHDWDAPDCDRLVRRLATALPAGGHLLVHDVLLDDTLDGPLAIALYSAALFTLTEGRAYAASEFTTWLQAAGLRVAQPIPTLAHCHLIPARKP